MSSKSYDAGYKHGYRGSPKEFGGFEPWMNYAEYREGYADGLFDGRVAVDDEYEYERMIRLDYPSVARFNYEAERGGR